MTRTAGLGQWLRDQFAFALVLAGVAACFVYLLVQPGHWVRGTGGIAIMALVGAAMRLCLPTARVGMLAVRSRWLDTLAYAALGAVILVVAVTLRYKGGDTPG